MFLFVFNQGIGNPVKKLLCALIAKVLDTLAPKTVVDRKANAHQRYTQATGNVISFAISDHQIGFQVINHIVDRFEIHTFENKHFLSLAIGNAVYFVL